MKIIKRFYFCGLFIHLLLLILSSPAFGAFPYNPLPPYIGINPLRDEAGYMEFLVPGNGN